MPLPHLFWLHLTLASVTGSCRCFALSSYYAFARKLTITKDSKHPDHISADPESLALSALAWVLTEPSRAERLLSLTGLTAEVLRDNLTDLPVMAAVLEFLANHEPDLVLAADALNVPPATLIAAHESLSR